MLSKVHLPVDVVWVVAGELARNGEPLLVGGQRACAVDPALVASWREPEKESPWESFLFHTENS